jgi:TM2 domain-containing membrane protein YozV
VKSRTTAGMLALFLGGIGIHKFYLDRPFQGLLYMGFCWTFIPAILGFLEAISFFTTDDADFNAVYNPGHVASDHSSPVSDLRDLVAMKEAGHLSSAEFESEKRRLLAR